MQTINLELAKEIAGKYELLGVEVPTSNLGWVHSPIEWQTIDLRLNNIPGYYVHFYRAYSATEIFSALPPVVGVEKVYTVHHSGKTESRYRAYIRKNNGESAQVESNNPIEALGMMMCRVLDEEIKQKEARDERK